MSSAGGKKRSLFHRAFFNQYNFILMSAAGLFSIATFTWIPLLLGAGVEALWLVLGSDSGPFKRWVAIQESLEERTRIEQRAKEALETLEPVYLHRFRELSTVADRIQTLATENPSLETQLVQGEMDKLGKLLHSFLEMALTHQRLGHYLKDNDETDMHRDLERTERALAGERDPDVAASLRQALTLAQKRLKQHQSIEASHRLLGVKLDTLDKSFRYLESHVVGISEREQLSEEIDELILGVDAVSELGVETEGTLRELREAPRRAPAAQARAKN